MACFRPLRAYRTAVGSVVFSELARDDVVGQLELPCGQCIGCRLDRARDWTARCVHESRLHDVSCFLTLTYSDECLPPGGGLRYSDFQGFLKRLRRRVGKPLRFFMCGEYGDQLGRPHYHAIIFGWRPTDMKLEARGPSGQYIHCSALLADLWPLGMAYVGEFSPQSAGYVARYSLKKVTGDDAVSFYRRTLADTGEVVDVAPPFLRCSLRPGIGAGAYERWSDDYHVHDFAVVDGKKQRVPRYYDKLLKRGDIERLEELKFAREGKARAKWENNTDARLKVREEVLSARVRNLKREL